MVVVLPLTTNVYPEFKLWPVTVLSPAELAAVERSLRVVLGMY